MKQGFGFKMLKTAGAVLVAAVATGVQAAPPADTGLITFDGAVSSTTCTLTTSNGISANNLTVSMPVVSKDEVEGTNLAQGVGSKTFELLLTNCPDIGGVSGTDPLQASIAFTSTQFVDLSNGTLHADPTVSGAAQNVNIALYNNTATNTAQVKIGDPSDIATAQAITMVNGAGSFAYRAAYVPGSSVSGINPVTPGIVSTNTTFTISYQ
ncbi:fimbrial protein [Scandinavium sp. H11S7]|uniref:Fimbrial protein n=1 Tax=Scandinavium hiltneri TaxID=2926519 RepID=A0ABT2E5K5_9ENTR|nr:fimbrial protein [Scandinavium hiltneri]MCS2158538.1 fimbrial protein [Scandinavium hiltneri]MCS2163163.1 fimbrial protein [Scandinavium hiltneri]